MRAVDGRSGIAELRDGYAELMIIDAFVGPRVPAELGTAEFFASARRVLAEPGMLIMNLTDRGPFGYARRVLSGIAESFPHLALCS